MPDREEIACPDPQAGLYIQTRTGSLCFYFVSFCVTYIHIHGIAILDKKNKLYISSLYDFCLQVNW